MNDPLFRTPRLRRWPRPRRLLTAAAGLVLWSLPDVTALREALKYDLLAAILPGPRVAFNPQLKPEKVRRRAARPLQLLQRRGILDEAQYGSTAHSALPANH